VTGGVLCDNKPSEQRTPWRRAKQPRTTLTYTTTKQMPSAATQARQPQTVQPPHLLSRMQSINQTPLPPPSHTPTRCVHMWMEYSYCCTSPTHTHTHTHTRTSPNTHTPRQAVQRGTTHHHRHAWVGNATTSAVEECSEVQVRQASKRAQGPRLRWGRLHATSQQTKVQQQTNDVREHKPPRGESSLRPSAHP
jgi:hypothetical protein